MKMDTTGNCYTVHNDPDSEKQIPCVFFHVQNLKLKLYANVYKEGSALLVRIDLLWKRICIFILLNGIFS